MPKFHVSYTFHGRTSKTVEANSIDDARTLLDAEVDADEFHLDADEIDDVDFRIDEMFPVTRDGSEIWTTYVRGGDVRGHYSELDKSPLFSQVD